MGRYNHARAEADRRAAYRAYLQSETWQEKRELVLARDHGWCQGCFKRPATEVHHLTYKRFGRELVFDLVSVCDACHNQIHGR